MIEFFKHLLDTDGFPPRWHCGSWSEGHGWLHVISDVLIFGAYTAIPVILLIFAWKKHREILFAKLVWLFAAFILACGVGHLIEATIFWHPWYRLSGFSKAVTAAVSWATVIAIVRQMPEALSVPGLISVNRRLKETIAEQQRAALELERSNEDLDQFAYVASHDLRAPLRSIRHLATWVEEDCAGKLSEESKGHLQKLHQRVDRLDVLMNDLLDYSRAGRDLSEAESVDIGSVVRLIVSDLETSACGFGFEISDPFPPLVTWRVPFEQVMRNLLSNAVKHHHREDGRVRVSAHLDKGFVDIVVADDGPGIAVEFHERIFGMFQTLKSKDEVEGSGMGLAIVAKLVQRMGGAISVRSEEGGGVAFIVKLPSEPSLEN